MNPVGYIPSPAENGFHVGPFFVHAYGLAYVFAVLGAIVVTRLLWSREGEDPRLPQEIAVWAFPAGLIGGRIYFLITTPSQIPPHWWGPFAIWKGGLGIWGGIAGGVAVGLWYVRRRRHLSKAQMLKLLDCAAPGLLVIKHHRGEESGKFVNVSVLEGDQIKMVDEQASSLPDCPSLTTVWPGAEFQEREVYDLMGINFVGHPDMTRILTEDDFPGHPLRKDFALMTREAKPWPGGTEEEIEE